jgi:hypothetical protein
MVSGVAFPPTSRKLALFPFKRWMVSFVDIARPAPLTTLIHSHIVIPIVPILPPGILDQ